MNRASITYFGAFDAECLGLTVDAFTGGALIVEEPIEGSGAVEGNAHQTTQFHVDVLDAPFAFLELLVITGVSGGEGYRNGQR